MPNRHSLFITELFNVYFLPAFAGADSDLIPANAVAFCGSIATALFQ